MSDEQFAATLRQIVDTAPVRSPLDPGAVTARVRSRQRARRLTGAGVAALALVGIATSLGPAVPSSPRDTNPAAAPFTPSGPTPTPTMNAWTEESLGTPGHEIDPELLGPGTVGGYEGWWNGTPASETGGILPFDEWPQENRDHPRTATYNTRTGTLVETYDLIAQEPIANYVPVPDPTWPANSIVILDADTDEVLDHFPVHENGSTGPDGSLPGSP